MLPSSKYDVDTTVDYGGGAVISLTKTLRNNLYTLNQDTDLSICYSNYISDALTHIDQNLSPYNTETDTSTSYGTITEASYSRTLKDWVRNAPANKIYAGFALYYDTDGTDRSNFWGYRGSASAVSGDANGRFLHDIDYNKLVFPMGNISVYDKSVYDNIDYDTYPTSQYGSATTPSSHNISLSTLDANPGNYYVNDFSFSNAYIYRPNNNDWVSTSIRPVLFINGTTVGGVSAYKNPFLGFYNSNIGTTTTNPNNNPSAGGGGETPKVYNNLQTGYSIGFSNNFTIKQTKFANIQDAFTWGKAKYQEIYGTASGTHNLYFEHQEIDLGDSIMCLQWFIEIKYVGWWVPPYVNCNVQFLLKGDFVTRYLAGTGLYWSIDGSMPTGLTPTTLHTSNKIWLGAMNENGTTTGTWVKGADIYTYSGYNKIGNTANPDYDPSSGGGGGSDKDDMDLTEIGFTSSIGGAAFYWVFNAPPTGVFDDFNEHAPEGSMLSQNIVSCYVSALNYAWHTANQKIVIYTNGSQKPAYESTEAYPLIYNDKNPHFVVGKFDVPRQTNTFYDFSPYSTYELFIPFCGWMGLPDTVAGRSIRVYMDCDVATCTCKAIVMLESEGGETIIGEITGNFGAPCPVQVVEGGLYKQAAINSGLQIASGVASGIYGASAGAGALAISGFSNALQGIQNLHAAGNTNYGQTIGRAGDCSNLGGGHYCKIRITHPVVDEVVNNSMFGHTVGYLCNTVGKLSSFSGFTVCINPHITGIDCTDEEKEEIKGLLENGVIL